MEKPLPPGQLSSHDLNDETDPKSQHSVEKFGLRLDEHGEIHQQLLRVKEHANELVLVHIDAVQVRIA